MGLPRGTDSPCRIPVRSNHLASPPMKYRTGSPSTHHRARSPSARPSLEKSCTSRNNARNSSCLSYKQPSVRTLQLSETSYLPPRGINKQQHPNFEKNFGPFGTVHQQRHFNSCNNNSSGNDAGDINSMFRRPEYDSPISRSERIAGSYRLIEAARNTTPVKGGEYGTGKTWDTGLSHDPKDNGNPLLRPSQLPPPNEPIVNGGVNSGPSTSRKSVNRSEDLERILAKYGKSSKSNLNEDKDPDFTSIVRTDTTLRVTSTDSRYCKPTINPGPGIHAYWDGHPNQQQQEENDIISKLNTAMKGRPSSSENLHNQRNDRTVQLPGPDGPVLAPIHLMENKYQVSPAHQYGPPDRPQNKSQTQAALRRSTHVFPFKETPSGHLVIDPVQIAFESRKISVLVSDPNNNTATVEFTTTKCGTNNINMFHGNQPCVNKNERILHEVKKAMSIQETNENNAIARNSNSKLPLHQQPRELNQKRYSDSKKATEEFEQSILHRVVTGKNADTHVMIGDKIYPCHSLALESFSTYFERLSRPSENIQRIQLPEAEVTVTAFPILMDWIVQSEEGRKGILTKENLVTVYAAARYLGMRDLELQCIRFLERKVDSSDPDLMTMWDDVKRRQPSALPELVRIIAGKMAASYHEIYRARRFLQMEIDELFMLLNSDDISIDSEMDVYDSAVSWLLHDWKNRKVHTNKIMSTVRFGLLSPLQLTQINLCPEISKVKNEKDYNQIVTYGTVKSMIDAGLSFSILDESYKNQPDELQKWVEKTGVKAPAPRSCLLNRKRASPLILDKIASLEGASQTKLETSFHKLPAAEKSSSYTLLGKEPKPGTPCIEPSSQGSGNSSYFGNVEGINTSKYPKGKSNLPLPRASKGGANGSGIFTVTDKSGRNDNHSLEQVSNQESGTTMQELMSKQKLQSNSSNTLQNTSSETDGPNVGASSTDPYYSPKEYEYGNNFNSSSK